MYTNAYKNGNVLKPQGHYPFQEMLWLKSFCMLYLTQLSSA